MNFHENQLNFFEYSHVLFFLMVDFVKQFEAHAFIYSGQTKRGKKFFLTLYQLKKEGEQRKKAQILASLTCQIRLSFATVVLCQTAPLLTWHLPLILGTKTKDFKPWISFLKGKYLFFSVFSPFTLVFQLYLPPLAEICICLGQTVFPPLSLLYAAALLLDPQWQWRGTLVFNLFSHSQILCFQVINLCSPFTACCMFCDWSVHVFSKLMDNIKWWRGWFVSLWHLWCVS